MNAHLRLVESYEDRHWRRMEELAHTTPGMIDAMKIGLMGELMRLVKRRLPDLYPTYARELERIHAIERRVNNADA